MSIFTQQQVRRPASSWFNQSHDVKLSCHAGNLVPVLCKEVLPGDVFVYKNTNLTRLSPMIGPTYHEIDVTTTAFFVPLRLLWDNYEKFFGSGVPDSNTPVAPYFNIPPNGVPIGSLADYLGLPTGQYMRNDGIVGTQYTSAFEASAFPFAAYYKIYNDWYRDQNLINNGEPYKDKLTDGLNNYADYSTIRQRAWQHDYFTSALPFAQKGDPVEVPLESGTSADVVLKPGIGTTAGRFAMANGTTATSANQMSLQPTSPNTDRYVPATQSGTNNLRYDPNGTLMADLSASGIDIENLRWAMRLQEFLEKNAVGGTRYIELMRAHFDVRSSDARLQRSELIGSETNAIVISEVLQTSASTTDDTPQGNMAGHGLSFGKNGYKKYFAEEHGFYMVLQSIKPRTSYYQGVDRMWTRKSPLDYAWPTFAHLGEQEVLNKEIFLSGNPTNDNATFGYLPRYTEYRYSPSRVAGEFRTSYYNWHLGRIFDSIPGLNGNFVNCVPSRRIFAVNTEGDHNYLCHVKHNLRINRRLPKYGRPTL